ANNRPPATAGCPYADEPFGNPNAHFNCSDGTCAGVRPALAAVCAREFIASLPQPDHRGPVAGLRAGFAWHWCFIDDATPDTELPRGRPDSNSASERFCPSGM